MAFVSNLYLAFERIAKDNADRVALLNPVTSAETSYRELGLLAEHIAKILCAKGLHQGQVAAFFHDKSPEAFAAMLACLRLGIIYTNLDPDSPWERVRKILTNCKPNLIVNAFDSLPFANELRDAGIDNILHLSNLSAPNGVALEFPEVNTVAGGTPAYIMFTSGSTGTPKGAVMSHANLLWFVQWAQDRFGISQDDVISNVNPIYFDNSVFDFYSAIFAGATLVPFNTQQVKDGRLLLQLISKTKCTIWFSVPSLLVYLLTTRALTKEHFPNIRKIIFGGEGFPKPKLRELFELFGARAQLENVYGPTECTCICSAKTIHTDDFLDMQGFAPLGRLSQNFDYEIVPQDATVPDFGELFLRGPQVGLGYYDDQQRTRAAFTQNPIHDRYADVGYKTGDLVHRDTQGSLHFKGRVDFQIKHMGYRVELEEIEAALNTLDGVSECAVVHQQMDGGIGKIIAFVSGTELLSTNILLELNRILPLYMLPKRVEVVSVLPKNANGKIDRVKLLEATSK